MSRRRDNSAIGMLFDLLLEAPWWVGVIAAVVMYVGIGVILTGIAEKKLAGKGLALFFPKVGVVFALLCLVAGAASYIRSLSRRKLLDGQQDLDSIRALSWRDFERLVGEAYRRQGYSIQETGGGGADGGVDLVLYRGGEKTIVQCKRWRERLVGVSVIREVYGVMVAEGAVHGIVVTAGTFSPDAVEFARGKSLTLVSGDELAELVRSVQREVSTAIPTPSVARSTGAVPTCHVCGRPMVLRTATKGQRAGSQFWGCPGYPGCRGVRHVREKGETP